MGSRDRPHPGAGSGFYQQVLFGPDWVCIANPDHPRIGHALTLNSYREEAHIGSRSGTGHRLLNDVLESHHIKRRVALELPGFLGLAAIVSTTDLIATLPRHSGETLAASTGLGCSHVLSAIPSFTVKQHWHARYHHDPASRWLRGVCETLFQQRTPGPTQTRATRPRGRGRRGLRHGINGKERRAAASGHAMWPLRSCRLAKTSLAQAQRYLHVGTKVLDLVALDRGLELTAKTELMPRPVLDAPATALACGILPTSLGFG